MDGRDFRLKCQWSCCITRLHHRQHQSIHFKIYTVYTILWTGKTWFKKKIRHKKSTNLKHNSDVGIEPVAAKATGKISVGFENVESLRWFSWVFVVFGRETKIRLRCHWSALTVGGSICLLVFEMRCTTEAMHQKPKDTLLRRPVGSLRNCFLRWDS